MCKTLKDWFNPYTKDRHNNYHQMGCTLRNHKFTVIRNTAGSKINESCIKYCPCCGVKLKG